MPRVPSDLLSELDGALPRHRRLLVALWLLGDGSPDGDRNAFCEALRAYEEALLSIDSGSPKLSLGAILLEMDVVLQPER